MIKEKELIKNTGIIFIGKLGVRFLTFMLLPMYTWILLPSDLGKYDLINTYISFLTVIFGFQMENALFRELSINRKNISKIKSVISSAIFALIGQCCLYILFFLVFKNYFHFEYISFLLTNVILAMILNNFLGITRGLGNNKAYSILGIIVAITMLISNIILLLYFRLGIEGLFLSTLLSQLVGIIYLTFKLRIYNYVKLRLFRKNELKNLYKYAIPLIPNELSWNIIRISDRVIVSKFLPLSVLGYMSVGNKLSQILLELFSIFGLSWTEMVVVNYHKGLEQKLFKQTVRTAMRIFVSLAVFLLIGIKLFYPFLIKNDYIFAYNLIPIYIIGILFNIYVGLISTIYVAKGESKKIAGTSFVIALVNIVVNFLFIKKVGAYIAPVSTTVAFFILGVLRHIYLDKKYKSLFTMKEIVLYSLFVLFVICIYFMNLNFFALASILLIITVVVIINIKIIKLCVFKIKSYILGRIRKNV